MAYEVKDPLYTTVKDRFPTRRARVNRTPGEGGITRKPTLGVTDPLTPSVSGMFPPNPQQPNNLGPRVKNAAGKIADLFNTVRDITGQRKPLGGQQVVPPPEATATGTSLATGFPPIGQRIRDYLSKSPGYVEPEFKVSPVTLPPPKAAPVEAPATPATPAVPAAPEQFKPDFNKPFWWLNDQLGETRPIQLIRGTNVTWQSPVDGKEYATAREAFEGQTTEARIESETKGTEHARSLELEALKGQYGIAQAQATPRKRYEIDQDTLSPTAEPNVLDTFEGSLYPGGVQQGAAANQEGVAEAQASLLEGTSAEVGAQTLRGLTQAKRQSILESLYVSDKAKAQAILKILDKISTK